ncbi:MAG: sensor histidine kinase [Planctomycetota bacterium]|jgi:signal transduction histidine kinase
MSAVVSHHAIAEVGVEDLKELMRSVNETAQRLQSTHGALRTQVSRLQGELAEANAQLRRSRSLAALGEMAAGIAHEVRNPLGSIQLYVQMLAEDLADRPELAARCGKIARAVDGLDGIVRDVLLFARDMTVTPVETTAATLVDRALVSCESLLAGGRVEVLREVPTDCCLSADASLMAQALGNLIRNAVEAMVEADVSDRRLHLNARRQPRRTTDGRSAVHVVLSVRDNGPGIPPEVHERMFNPFFTTRTAGTGLGLAIVHRIVDAHGGHISVRNARTGGAEVELCIPPQPAGTLDPADTGFSIEAQIGNGL